MIGLVLAAGTGRRLRPHTDHLPKTLVPLGSPGQLAADGRPVEPLTPLDVILANFAQVGITDVAVVVGFAADAVRRRQPEFERRYGVTLELVPNERALTWNNCYSLWCAREHLAGADVVLANGDTVHPVSVDQGLVDSGVDSALVLAVDTGKVLGAEEMKVTCPDGSRVARITKQMDPREASGEYIGVALLPAAVGPPLVEALEATWRRDPSLYYEDGFQTLIDAGDVRVEAQSIGAVPWIEIDDNTDLARATKLLETNAISRPRPMTGAPDRLSTDKTSDLTYAHSESRGGDGGDRGREPRCPS